ncbi:MAG: hypothetical protein MMC33_008475 [Icmadophila ericetorum]|nr:hypothetical protein [Icmadophila ericetorum]
MLLDFPPEIIQAIVKQVESLKDLKSLCEVSRSFYHLTIPVLYETVTITATEGLHTSFKSMLSSKRAKGHLKMIKNFTLQAPFHRVFFDRCLHFHDGDSELYDEEEFSFCFYNTGKEVMDFLTFVPENSLRSFSWDLGSCIPDHIFGHNGALSVRQKHIEHLSLIGDPSCIDYPGRETYMDLSEFKNLKSISWKLLLYAQNNIQLSACLKANAGHLQSLTIDLGDWDEAMSAWMLDQRNQEDLSDETDNFFAKRILGLSPHQDNVIFPSLATVSFSSISFVNFEQAMFRAVNITGLHTLKLWNCERVESLLSVIIAANEPLRLKVFELVQDSDRTSDYMGDPSSRILPTFLERFTGLEDLYLLLNDDEYWTAWSDIARGISHHKDSLKRLALHERFLNENEYSDQCHSVCDMDIALCAPEAEILEIEIQDYQRQRQESWYLEDSEDGDVDVDTLNGHDRLAALSFGRRMISILLQDTPCPLSSKNDKAVSLPGSIHTDMQCLAQWAFGPHGLPDLQILAFGDFSHKGRYKDHTALLCRDEAAIKRMVSKRKGLRSDGKMSEWTYRHLREDDMELQELLRRNMSALEACAVDGIFTSDCYD